MRAIAFVYSKIICCASEGGLKEFFEENCAVFHDWSMESEQLLIFTTLFGEFETRMEKILEDFAETENMTPAEISEMLASISEGTDSKAAKGVQQLLRGIDYKKFCTVMRTKASEIIKDLGDEVGSTATGATTSTDTGIAVHQIKIGGDVIQNTSADQDGDKKTTGRDEDEGRGEKGEGAGGHAPMQAWGEASAPPKTDIGGERGDYKAGADGSKDYK